MTNTLKKNIESKIQAIPFTTYVVKVSSRCNLNCSYCYMYNLQDKTYRDQPPFMEELTTQALGVAIRKEAETHNLKQVHIILHGGEPLLLRKKEFENWIKTIKKIFRESDIKPLFSVQSNGTLIDEEWILLLNKLGVRIGLSVDGPQEHHDQFRVDHTGRGTFQKTLTSIRLLQSSSAGQNVFSTVMAVVNPSISPLEFFKFWQELAVPGFDLSLPHANHVHLPPHSIKEYGQWLIEFFDLWFDQNRPDRHVRYFENMLRMFFEYPISTDNIGGRPVGVIVVETNGDMELTDAFKSCAEGMTKVSLNVLENDFSELHTLPMVRDLQNGSRTLCATCQACPAFRVCGGGYMPHRYGHDGTFDHPSIYCEALLELSHHMRKRVVESLPDSIKSQLGVDDE